jgi:hypothetical protein
MEFSDAFKHFQHFFKDKTGIDWDMRLEKPARNNSTTIVKGKDGKGQVKVERRFTWTPPVRGRPVGQLPLGYVRPEEREDVIKKHERDSGSGSGSDSGEDTSGSGSGEESSSSDDSGGSGKSGSDSENSEGEEKSGEDVVYDTDSNVDSDEEVDEAQLRSGINFGADLALARAVALKARSKVIEID